MSSSLSSVVSDLVRASMGTSVSPSVTDEDLDRHVRELLIKDAKKRAEKYGQQGIRAYLASGLSESNAPKANKRFLSSIIRSTDDHNKTILRAQALAAEDVKRERRETERREKKARAVEAVEAEKLRKRRSRHDESKGWDRWDGRTADRKRKHRDWETWNGDDGEDEDTDRNRDRDKDRHSHRSSRRRRRSRSRDRHSHRHSSRRSRSRERYSGSSRRHSKRRRSRSMEGSQERERDGPDYRRSDSRRSPNCAEESPSRRTSRRNRSRSRNSSRAPDKKRPRDEDDPPRSTNSKQKKKKYALSSDSEHEKDYDDQPRRRRRSRSSTSLSQENDSRSERRSTQPHTSSATTPNPSTEREAELSKLVRSKRTKESEKEFVVGSSKDRISKPRMTRSASPDTKVNNERQSSQTLSDDDRMSMSSSPNPGPDPAPNLPSKMDRYFDESYDPRLDITSLSVPQVPATGLINNAEFEGWDAMLELLRVRREDKAEKKRLERMGLSKDEVKRSLYGTTTATAGESISSSGVRDRWNAEGTSVMDIQYSKRGTVREWDMGKADF
ncbi:hypothetical protein E1B28_001789 [Marasmius oreades]|uniref:Uncharacterized protein n=1 Tax=Marasmius oreades TaxID=181124 RepID=A0A9P8AFJ4_9AGAR|nr:uncharacterized protein E1B28_001789 [Marasmius oreades]KAG7100001.1 hypothetical protein E1B28_001789 [Marasmius oreades]